MIRMINKFVMEAAVNFVNKTIQVPIPGFINKKKKKIVEEHIDM